MKLYVDPRSSSCLRVLSALAFKGISIERVELDLAQGEQFRSAVAQGNPGGLLPVLELEGGEVLTQSMAIIEWLEISFPQPSCVPVNAIERARMRELCSLVASDLHVMASLRLRRALTTRLAISEAKGVTWSRDWTEEGLRSLENTLKASAMAHAVGNAISMADFFVVPALFNAERSGIDLGAFPIATKVYESALLHPAFDCVLQQRTTLGT